MLTWTDLLRMSYIHQVATEWICYSIVYTIIFWRSSVVDQECIFQSPLFKLPESKVHGANMRPTWALSVPDGPHVGPMNLALKAVVVTSSPVQPLLCFSLHSEFYAVFVESFPLSSEYHVFLIPFPHVWGDSCCYQEVMGSSINEAIPAWKSISSQSAEI